MSAKIAWEALLERVASRAEVTVLSGRPDKFHLAVPVEARCCCGTTFTSKARGLWYGFKRSCGCLSVAKAAVMNPSKWTYAAAIRRLHENGFALLEAVAPESAIVQKISKPGTYTFRCRCGTAFGKTTPMDSLLSGACKSCGCAFKEGVVAAGIRKRGRTRTAAELAGRLALWSVQWSDIIATATSFDIEIVAPKTGSARTADIVECRCRCGTMFYPRTNDLLRGWSKTCGCTPSHIERELFEFVQGLAPDAVRNTRKVIPPREIDVWLPSKKIGIELHGVYWHSDAIKDRRDAMTDISDKAALMAAAGIRGIFIFEDEWKERGPQVKDYLRAILGKKETVGARKCLVEEGGRDFIGAHHIQGAGSHGQTYISLRYAGATIAAAAFRSLGETSRAHGANSWDLTRYCVGPLSVSGGLSKILAAFRKMQPGARAIVSYSDNRWSSGNLYRAAGFTESTHTPPRYSYCRGEKRYHRFKFRKSELQRLGWLLPGETEEACMRRKGYGRVWDAGKTKWVLTPLPGS